MAKKKYNRDRGYAKAAIPDLSEGITVIYWGTFSQREKNDGHLAYGVLGSAFILERRKNLYFPSPSTAKAASWGSVALIAKGREKKITDITDKSNSTYRVF